MLSPIGAHSDAHGNGRIAARILCPMDVAISLHRPARFTRMADEAECESPIYLFELAATILTARAVASRSDYAPRTCILCIDNKAALSAITKGSASSELGTILVNLIWSAAARRSGGLSM